MLGKKIGVETILHQCLMIQYNNNNMITIFQMDNTNQPESELGKEFEKYMFVSHLYAMRCAFGDISSLSSLVVKLLVALLRYTDIVPADKAYYEAGIATRVRKEQYN